MLLFMTTFVELQPRVVVTSLSGSCSRVCRATSSPSVRPSSELQKSQIAGVYNDDKSQNSHISQFIAGVRHQAAGCRILAGSGWRGSEWRLEVLYPLPSYFHTIQHIAPPRIIHCDLSLDMHHWSALWGGTKSILKSILIKVCSTKLVNKQHLPIAKCCAVG